jgi:hypothetical protein
MSAENPPTFSFNGIDFNPTYYVNESTSSGITREQANTLYLQKTIPDTATVTETFTGGIKTDVIESVTPVATFTFLNNQTGILHIGTANNRTGNINIANTQTTGTGNIVIGSNALTTGSQDITINRPLTIGYTSTSSFNQLGNFQQFYSNNITMASSTSFTQIWETPSLPIGIYNITYQLKTVPSTPLVFSKRFFGITSDNTGVSFPDTAYQEYGKAETFNTSTTESFNTTIKVTTAAKYYYLFKATFSSGAGTIAGFMNVTRIG